MLFGHQNDDSQMAGAQPTPFSSPAQNPLAIDPVTGSSLPVPPVPPLDAPATDRGSILNQGPSLVSPSLPPEASVTDNDLPSAPEPPSSSFDEPVDAPVADDVAEPEQVTPTEDAPAVEDTASDLLSLKQQALAELQPLVGQLDQTPEEKFRTTMMLIQSSDNHALLQKAYDCAQAIPDEKARAQALLDVVNEINYFTQQKS